MDRQTIAQAVAMLVVLAALVRWLPPAAPGDLLGRGDPRELVSVIVQVARDPDSPQAVGRLRNSLGARDPRAASNMAHWAHLTLLVRELRGRAQPGDVVQLRNVDRNDMWMLAYDLYPLRTTGTGPDAGGRRDLAVEPDADWVLTGCALAPGLRCELQRADDARGAGP
jgi:hypothetical protein